MTPQEFMKALTQEINLSLQKRNKGAIRNRHTAKLSTKEGKYPKRLPKISITYDGETWSYFYNPSCGITAQIYLEHGLLKTHIINHIINQHQVIEKQNLLADPKFNITQYISQLTQDLQK